MNNKVLISFLFIHLIVFSAQSQDTLIVSRESVVHHVLENNLQIKMADQRTEMSKGDFNQSKALYLPAISASHTALRTNNPLMAFGSKLNQEILTAQDFDPNRLNDPQSISNFATEIQVLQPLLNLDGVYKRQAAGIQLEVYELQAARASEHMEMEAIKAYMQLQLSYEAVAVLLRAKHTVDQNVQLLENYFDQGLIKKTDLLDVRVRQVEVENQLSYARSNVRNASDYLATLSGETAGDIIYKPEKRIPDSIERETFAKTMIASRKDIAAMNKSVLGYEKILKANQVGAIPRVNAFGNYQLYDDKPLGFGASGYLVGLQLSWSLFDGNKRVGKVQKARAALEKASLENESYKHQSQLELTRANRQLADAENKVSLSRIAFEQKAEAYRIRKDRFEEGLEKTTDLLLAETQMFQKELEYRQAIFEHDLTKEYLRFLTR